MLLSRCLYRLRARLRALFGVQRLEREFNDELRFHLDQQTSEYLKQGMSSEEAVRAARAAFGNVPLLREDVRAVWRWRWFDQLVQDVRCGTRALTRSRGFAGMSVATLALTIGATTAIFSVVWGILLRPLPVAEPERLVRIVNIAYIGELVELRARARTLDVAAYLPPVDRTLTGLDEPLRLSVVSVTGDLLTRLGRTPVLGRGFGLDDERPGTEPSAVLSNALWRQRFGADPTMVGRTLLLDGVAHTVRGVMPPDFEFPSADLWVPMTVDVTNRVGLWARTAYLVGRLRPGVTLDAATTEVRALGPQFGRLFPWRMPDSHGTDVSLRTWREERLGEVRPTLLLLLGAVVAVWLIGTVNLTNLQQVRAAARRRELSLRAALGAGRGRVARQLLTESSLLGLFGGAAGFAVAYAGVPALVALLPADVPRTEGIRVNGLVLCFAAVVSLGTALAAGTLPALRAARLGQHAALAGLRGTVGGASGRRLGIFVTAEVAAAVMLVISAVLLARSLAVQVGVDVGFSADRLVAAEVAPSPVRHPNDAVRLDFYANLERRLRALPFVGGVGLSTVFQPFGALGGGSVFRIEGRPNPATEGGEWPWADLRTAVNADFLRTLEVAIIAGRPFTESDASGAQRVVLISQRLAETWWPDETAVGQRIAFPGSERDTDPWRTVVGVVADVRWQGPASEGTTLYLPLAQHVGAIDAMTLIVESSSDPTLVADSLRAVVASLDSETPVSRIRAVDDVMAQAVSRPRFTTALVLGFAVLGVVLGMLGVYGVVAYTAARQQRDIGIRLALGATRTNVRARFVGQALAFAAGGIVIGEVGAAVLMASLSSQLFGVGPWDPLTYAAVPVLFVALAVAAAWLPARRATKLDPVAVLRAE